VDAVFAHMLLCMALSTQEIHALVSEIRRVLRPGGTFVYTVRNAALHLAHRRSLAQSLDRSTPAASRRRHIGLPDSKITHEPVHDVVEICAQSARTHRPFAYRREARVLVLFVALAVRADPRRVVWADVVRERFGEVVRNILTTAPSALDHVAILSGEPVPPRSDAPVPSPRKRLSVSRRSLGSRVMIGVGSHALSSTSATRHVSQRAPEAAPRWRASEVPDQLMPVAALRAVPADLAAAGSSPRNPGEV
jgi:hypothetical protein